jgi:ribonucleoside-diphosphate reductase alpha chain
LRDSTGKVIETPKEMFMRVAKCVAKVDHMYDRSADVKKTAKHFFDIMCSLDFLPNSPTLMNAGLVNGQLSACFVLSPEDSMISIFEALKLMTLIQKTGGGTGFSFSKLRPEGDTVRSSAGVASGPISFMEVFDKATDVVKQGGRRRGANMGILSIHHPDITKFVTSKQEPNHLTNFNISVAITDQFMKILAADGLFELVNPRDNRTVKKLEAKMIFNLIAKMAWKTGEPGIVFIDEINRHNPTPLLGNIESTNPCGEAPLLVNESCNLGSINLSHMVSKGEIDWHRLRRVIRFAVHFLDNVIDANAYATPEIENITKANRKIGLGVMGFADMLIRLKVPYDSGTALNVARQVMKFVSVEAKKKSIELAEQRGSFPNFEASLWKRKGLKCLRNAVITTIAPTGTISIIAGCSSGIEPVFAIYLLRNVVNGVPLVELNPLFLEVSREEDFYSEALLRKIIREGSIQNLNEIPENIKKVFVTALDIAPEWHVKIQAVFQKYTDNGISKTVNLPAEATVEDVKRIFLLAYKLRCKGITVYRYGSRDNQVLNVERESTRTCPSKLCMQQCSCEV